MAGLKRCAGGVGLTRCGSGKGWMRCGDSALYLYAKLCLDLACSAIRSTLAFPSTDEGIPSFFKYGGQCYCLDETPSEDAPAVVIHPEDVVETTGCDDLDGGCINTDPCAMPCARAMYFQTLVNTAGTLTIVGGTFTSSVNTVLTQIIHLTTCPDSCTADIGIATQGSFTSIVGGKWGNTGGTTDSSNLFITTSPTDCPPFDDESGTHSKWTLTTTATTSGYFPTNASTHFVEQVNWVPTPITTVPHWPIRASNIIGKMVIDPSGTVVTPVYPILTDAVFDFDVDGDQSSWEITNEVDNLWAVPVVGGRYMDGVRPSLSYTARNSGGGGGETSCSAMQTTVTIGGMQWSSIGGSHYGVKFLVTVSSGDWGGPLFIELAPV